MKATLERIILALQRDFRRDMAAGKDVSVHLRRAASLTRAWEAVAYN